MKAKSEERRAKSAAALALLCGAVAFAQDAPSSKQDAAIERVLERIQAVEKDARANPGEDNPAGNPQGHFWGGKYYDSSMLILPRDEKVIQGLDRLTAFVRGGLWPDAARTLQEMMETFPTQILQLRKDPGLFVGVKAWCEETIRSSPEMLRAYRETFDDRVRVAMERALERMDAQALKSLALAYPMTTSGRELLSRLSALQAEAGDFDEAGFFLQRVLTLYPEDSQVAVDLMPRMAVILARLGNEAALRQLAADCADRRLGGVSIEAGGRRTTLGAFLKERIDALRASPRAAWDRTRLTDHFEARPATIGPSEVKWRYRLAGDAAPSPRGDSRIPQGVPGFEAAQRASFILPAVSGRRVMFNVSYKAVALDVRNGKVMDLVERIAAAGVADDSLQRNFVLRQYGGRQAPPLSFYAMTALGDHAYYSLYRSVEEAGQRGRAVQVNIRNLEARDFEARRQLFSLNDRKLSMLAPPEPVGDSLYCGFSSRENQTVPPDTHVARLDRLTGRPIWQTFLFMNTGKQVPMFGPFSEAPPVIVTFDRGILYCATNNGAFAALEALTGQILWIRTYEQKQIGVMPAPPLVYGHSVILGGSDTDELHCLDLLTGRVRWKVRELPIRAGSPAYIEGISGDRILMTGADVLCLGASNGKRLWKQPVRSSLAGKGALTDDSLYVPTADGIDRFHLSDGTPRAVLAWKDRDQDPGNLAAVEGGFLTFSERLVNFFAPASNEPPKDKPEPRDY
jgi:tetratricopeptide (TPR) repeat protein